MKKVFILGLLGSLIILDQILPRIADRQIRSSEIFDSSINSVRPNLNEIGATSRKMCEIHRAYVLYLFQVCFKPYTASGDERLDGYYLVYHKPKPRLSLVMPANGPESYYFEESSQGDFLLFIRRDGSIQYGDAR